MAVRLDVQFPGSPLFEFEWKRVPNVESGKTPRSESLLPKCLFLTGYKIKKTKSKRQGVRLRKNWFAVGFGLAPFPTFLN